MSRLLTHARDFDRLVTSWKQLVLRGITEFRVACTEQALLMQELQASLACCCDTRKPHSSAVSITPTLPPAGANNPLCHAAGPLREILILLFVGMIL